MFSSYVINKKRKAKWTSYQARGKKGKRKENLNNALALQDWTAVLEAETSSQKARELDKILGRHMDASFPIKTFRKRSDDLPWITHGIRELVRKRKEVFKTDKKRSEPWKKLKNLSDNLMVKSKKDYIDR